jgi:ABC-type multidrug transport system permease subunit
MTRSWILAQREPRISRAKIGQTLIVAFFLIPTFWQLNDFANCNEATDVPTCKQDNAVEFHSMVGAIYFLCVMQMFLNFLPTVIVFQGEKPVFVRERAGNMYDIWVYATTKMIAEIPIMLLVPMMLLIFVYPAIGFQDRLSEFFKFYLILALMV